MSFLNARKHIERENHKNDFLPYVVDNMHPNYQDWYKAVVKGTTGEELADVIIRIFDYVVGWNLPFEEGEFDDTMFLEMFPENFSEGLFEATQGITDSFYENIWEVPVFFIMKFAEYHNIDLEWHIEHKQKYNRTRPYLHGKKY